MRIVAITLLIFLMSACYQDDGFRYTEDYGPLPDSASLISPYVDGELYFFRHSEGVVITFQARREKFKEYFWWDEDDNTQYRYEVDRSRLIPQYPIFEFLVSIDNSYGPAWDLNCAVLCGNYGSRIPYFDQDVYYDKADSIVIDSLIYYDVFKLAVDEEAWYVRNPLYVDSIYYNYEYGFLKVIMSNDERYTIYR